MRPTAAIVMVAAMAVLAADARTLQQNPSIGDVIGSIAQTVGQGLNGVVPIATGALNIANSTAVGAVSSVSPNSISPAPPMDPVAAAVSTAIQGINAAAQNAARAAADIGNGTDVLGAIRSAVGAAASTANATIAAVVANNPNNASEAIRSGLDNAISAINSTFGGAKEALNASVANATGAAELPAAVAAGVLGAVGGVINQIAAAAENNATTPPGTVRVEPVAVPPGAASAGVQPGPLVLAPSGTVSQAVDTGVTATTPGYSPVAVATTVAPPTSSAAGGRGDAALLLAGVLVAVQLLG